MNNQSLGHYGEEEACKYLQSKGYVIVERNFRNKLGEIDLIAKKGGTIHFIEVKTRRSFHYGAPFEAVSSLKQHKMVRLALSYLKYKFRSIDIPSCFDVISIYKNSQGKLNIEHINNAFDLTYLSH